MNALNHYTEELVTLVHDHETGRLSDEQLLQALEKLEEETRERMKEATTPVYELE